MLIIYIQAFPSLAMPPKPKNCLSLNFLDNIPHPITNSLYSYYNQDGDRSVNMKSIPFAGRMADHTSKHLHNKQTCSTATSS